MILLRDKVRGFLGITSLQAAIDQAREALGVGRLRELAAIGSSDITDHELKVHSQFGEDGIIQFLIQSCPRDIPQTFVEIGVEDYSECNTRLLASSFGWRGLAIDGEARYVKRMSRSDFFWRSGVRPIHAFVTRENVNEVLRSNNCGGQVGLLSLDIDGNDYWVLEQMTSIQPAIICVEYNAQWGAERAVSIPYEPRFDRWVAHSSGTYFGASLKAFVDLLGHRGYDFVGTNTHGSNAFFIHRSTGHSAAVKRVEDGVFDPLFDQTIGNAQATTGDIQNLPLVETRTGETVTVGELSQK